MQHGRKRERVKSEFSKISNIKFISLWQIKNYLIQVDFLIAKEYIEPLTVTPQVPPYSKDETGNITITHKDGSEVTVHIEVSPRISRFPIFPESKK